MENIEASYLSDGKCSEENNKFPIKFSITGNKRSKLKIEQFYIHTFCINILF